MSSARSAAIGLARVAPGCGCRVTDRWGSSARCLVDDENEPAHFSLGQDGPTTSSRHGVPPVALSPGGKSLGDVFYGGNPTLGQKRRIRELHRFALQLADPQG